MGNILVTEDVTLIKIKTMHINSTGIYIYDYYHSKPFFLDKIRLSKSVFDRYSKNLDLDQVIEIRFSIRDRHILDILCKYSPIEKTVTTEQKNIIKYPSFYQSVPTDVDTSSDF